VEAKPSSGRQLLLIISAITIASALIVVGGYFYISSLPRSEDHRMWTAMHLEIQSGDDLEHVQSVLGRGGTVVLGSEASALASSVLAFENPGTKILAEDEILTYEVFDESQNKCSYFLQFRDGVLIHHDPADYEEYNGVNLVQ
jgi:hypothetical protein